ncbi:DNA-binding protein H-NS [Paraburkholderia sp. BL6665CI2N2]|uniref:H-NS histone family protein n=1 Tax=Paraburkholderia sp. BL6665CI2N2 TaxID=1938806 RepID=UPI001065486F|nr:H-NS histone family protein [Paraburkholderia sp. BL6665CI2N2]TDY22067.1 DNA-binding protein H-NS [Paraburkholderia sp. BL6665CI2N2]
MATLSQIEQRIANLQKKADDLRRKKSASVISSIKKMMADHGLSVQDLEAETAELRKRGRPAGSKNGVHAAATKAPQVKVSPKYRDPVSGATWSGRARPPAWIKDAKDRSKFLIEGPAMAVPMTAKGKRG